MALIPWAAVTLWLLQGRRASVSVPYLALWETPIPVPRPRRKREVLPLAIIMALLAALLAIVAGAQPTLPASRSHDSLVATLIVDRGITMSARTPAGPRYVGALQALVDAIPPTERSGKLKLIAVPGNSLVEIPIADVVKAVQSLRPTARDTSGLVVEAVSAQLATAAGPVLVITDRSLEPRDRLIRIPPEGAIQDVGIALLAAREHPSSQVMIRVRNQSSLRNATLTISCDGRSKQQTIALPDARQTQDYFFNPPTLGATVTAELAMADDLPANNRAWLVRTGTSPVIEPRTPVSAELRRMIAAYQRSRPATEDSSLLILVSDAALIPADASAVLLQLSHEHSISGPVQVTPHALTAHVGWEQMPMPITIDGDPPAGWVPLVSIAGHAILAVRTDGLRQVWVGFDSPDWARAADYVVFWTNIFDWAAGPAERFTDYPLSQWTPEWKPTEQSPFEPGMWPGLYRRSDGALRAFNAPDVAVQTPQQTDWRDQLKRLSAATDRLDLSGPLLIAAAACMVIAALTWKKSRRASPALSDARLAV